MHSLWVVGMTIELRLLHGKASNLTHFPVRLSFVEVRGLREKLITLREKSPNVKSFCDEVEKGLVDLVPIVSLRNQPFRHNHFGKHGSFFHPPTSFQHCH